MATPKLVTGDDVAISVTLKKNNATFTIDPTATVTAALVDTQHTSTYMLPVAQSAAAPGADWANSLVVVEFAGTDTQSIDFQGGALLEIQIDDTVNTPGKTTFFAKVSIVSGLLP
jgi:hypothetical protein